MGTYARYYADKNKDEGAEEIADLAVLLPCQDYTLFSVLANIRTPDGVHITPVPHSTGFPDDMLAWVEEPSGYYSGTQVFEMVEVLSTAHEMGCFVCVYKSTDIVDYLKNHLKSNLASLGVAEDLVYLKKGFFDIIEKYHQEHGEFRLFVVFD